MTAPDRLLWQPMHITLWTDDLIAAHGHHPDHPDALAWAAIVGPSGWLLHRWLLTRHGTTVTVDDIAAALGLRRDGATKTLDRTVRFGLARHLDGRIEVRTHLPPLTVHQRQRLHPTHPHHLGAA